MGRKAVPVLTDAEKIIVKLIIDNEGLAVTIARDFFKNVGFEREDLIQEARIAIWEAARYWDHVRPFRTYAGVCIRQRLARYVGTPNKKPLPSGDQEALVNTAAKPRRHSMAGS